MNYALTNDRKPEKSMAKVRLPSQDRERRFKCAREEGYVNEIKDVPHLLSHLCRTITGPPWAGFGPNPLPYGDRLYCIVLTEFFTHSIRRSEPHYEAAYEKGHISKKPSIVSSTTTMLPRRHLNFKS